MKTFALVASVLLNVVLGGVLLYITLQGCAEIANGRVGVLAKDVKVGIFNTDKVLFTLPQGLVVRDASASGADRFEPYRFRIVVTSDDAALVTYAGQVKPLSERDSEYYSVEIGR